MKKSLLALAVLGTIAGAASAQSSVTLSGRVDAGLIRSNNQWSLGGSQTGYNAFTISGTEDLGGGMRAFFLMNHRFNIANGANNPGSNAANVNQFWRNAWVGLGGGFGDVRLGRMLMPLQEVNGGYDAFDTGTVGSVHVNGLFNVANVRTNSTIYYRTPNLGGLFVHAGIAAGEGQIATGGSATALATAFPNSERPIGMAVGYAAGPLSVAVAFDKSPLDRTTKAIYGKYNFGFMTLMGQYENGESSATTDTSGFSVSAVVPFGAGRLLAGVARIDPPVGTTLTKIGLGGEYSLSKRTLLYTDFGKVKSAKAMFDLGVRHSF